MTRIVPMLMLLAAMPAAAADKLRAVATTPDLAAIARSVGGEAVDVKALARPGEDPHFVDAKPSFIVTLNKADVLIEGGAGLEAGWLPPLLDGARNPRLALGTPGRIVASQGLALLEVPTQLDRSLGDVHPYGNPHYLLDPVMGQTVAHTIARGLCAVDGPRCADYEARATRFAADIDVRLPGWRAALAPARGQKVVTYHKNFDYFLERFDLALAGTLEPKPGIPPSPTHLTALVPRMKAAQVRAIIIEPYRDRQTPDFVAEKTGARVVVLPIMPDGADAPDYPGLIDHDVRQLAATLTP